MTNLLFQRSLRKNFYRIDWILWSRERGAFTSPFILRGRSSPSDPLVAGQILQHVCRFRPVIAFSSRCKPKASFSSRLAPSSHEPVRLSLLTPSPWRTAKPKSRNPSQPQRPSAVVARSRPVAPGPPEGRRPSRAAGGSAPTRIRACRRTQRGLLSGLVAGNRGTRPPPPPW